MRAARHSGVPWPQFRTLERDVQGQIVAFYEADTTLAYLEQKDAIAEARRRGRIGGKSRV
jgi:hypothetical protein